MYPALQEAIVLNHKDTGKKVFIGCDAVEQLRDLKGEFGQRFKQFYIGMPMGSLEEAEESLRVAGD